MRGPSVPQLDETARTVAPQRGCWLSELARLVVASGLLGDDVQAVPGVDHGDKGHQRGELVVIVVLGRVGPGLVADAAGGPADAGT